MTTTLTHILVYSVVLQFSNVFLHILDIIAAKHKQLLEQGGLLYIGIFLAVSLHGLQEKLSLRIIIGQNLAVFCDPMCSSVIHN